MDTSETTLIDLEQLEQMLDFRPDRELLEQEEREISRWVERLSTGCEQRPDGMAAVANAALIADALAARLMTITKMYCSVAVSSTTNPEATGVALKAMNKVVLTTEAMFQEVHAGRIIKEMKGSNNGSNNVVTGDFGGVK